MENSSSQPRQQKIKVLNVLYAELWDCNYLANLFGQFYLSYIFQHIHLKGEKLFKAKATNDKNSEFILCRTFSELNNKLNTEALVGESLWSILYI